jgi:hypothetical protein
MIQFSKLIPALLFFSFSIAYSQNAETLSTTTTAPSHNDSTKASLKKNMGSSSRPLYRHGIGLLSTFGASVYLLSGISYRYFITPRNIMQMTIKIPYDKYTPFKHGINTDYQRVIHKTHFTKLLLCFGAEWLQQLDKNNETNLKLWHTPTDTLRSYQRLDKNDFSLISTCGLEVDQGPLAVLINFGYGANWHQYYSKLYNITVNAASQSRPMTTHFMQTYVLKASILFQF